MFAAHQTIIEKLDSLAHSAPSDGEMTLITSSVLAQIADDAKREIAHLRAENRALVCDIQRIKQDQHMRRTGRSAGVHASNLT